MKINRRAFLLTSLAGAVALPGYGTLLESGWLELTRTIVPFSGKGLNRDLRLLHLSDFHAAPGGPHSLVERAITLGLAEKPDAAFLTGDYITRGRVPEPREYEKVLRMLSDAVPTFASFGNHDGGAWSATEGGVADLDPVRSILESAGVTCFHNQAGLATLAGQPFNIVGLGDLWAADFEPERAFAQLTRPDVPTIVLSHNPDTTETLGAFPCDLQLSGHTHGGQVVIPLVGAPYIPVVDRRFVEGLVSWRGRQVHITRGVGSILGIRFNCRPEVSILTLKH